MTTPNPEDPAAAPQPPYWIATGELWIRGPGGNVRAHNPGDRVSNARVVQHGWQDDVRDPGAPQDAPNAAEAEDQAITPPAPATAPASSQDRAQPPAATTSPASTTDSGPAAEKATT